MSLKKGGYKPEGGLYNGKDYPGHYQIDMQPKGKYSKYVMNKFYQVFLIYLLKFYSSTLSKCVSQ